MNKISSINPAVKVLKNFVNEISWLEEDVCDAPWSIEIRTDKEDTVQEKIYSIEGPSGAYGQDIGSLGYIYGDNMVWAKGGQGENAKFICAARILVPLFKKTIIDLLDEYRINKKYKQELSFNSTNDIIIKVANIINGVDFMPKIRKN